MLQIYLFGSFAIKRNGADLCLKWERQAHRLLALLVLNHNRAISTNWVTAALDMPEAVLPQSVSFLRKVLGEDDRDRLKHGNRQISFDTTGVSVDIFEFEKLIGKDAISDYKSAVDLYKGALLKDWDEEAWFGDESERLLLDYLDALEVLALSSADSNQPRRAVGYLRLRLDSYREASSSWIDLAEAYIKFNDIKGVVDLRNEYIAYTSQPDQDPVVVVSEKFLKVCNDAIRCSQELALPSRYPAGGSYTTAAAALPFDPSDPLQHETIGDVMAPQSAYYIERMADTLAWEAIERGVSFVLIKGASQVGKSSLIARLMRKARTGDARVVLTDWKSLPGAALSSSKQFLRTMAETFVEDLDLSCSPVARFVDGTGDTRCFENFIRRDVFAEISGRLIWFIDGADRLFETEYRDDVFALMRSWHGKRAFYPGAPWSRLTIVISYATEAHLFIQNLAQSPFNVGTRIELEDFTLEQALEMNARCGSPISSEADVRALYSLVGGHPYLIRRSLHEAEAHNLDFSTLASSVETSDTLFNDHLGRIRLALLQNEAVLNALRSFLETGLRPFIDEFLRLRASGIVTGDAPSNMSLRCKLYEIYLRRNIL